MITQDFLKEITQTYDVLTNKIKNDLDEQYKKGRIKGTDYAEVYAKLMAEALQLSLEEPIKRAQQELLFSQKIVEDKKALEIIAQTEKIKYETNNILPEQKILVQKQQNEVIAQTNKINYETDNILPEQKKLIQKQQNEINAQTNKINYETNNILPEQKNILQKQQEEITAQANKIKYETNNILPNQANMLKKQQELTEMQTNEIDFKIKKILPVQKTMIERQTKGFDDHLKQKMLDIQLNAWSLIFSAGMGQDESGNLIMPSIIKNDEVTNLYNNLKSQLGIN